MVSLSTLAFTGIENNSTSKVVKDNIFTAIRSIDYTSINVLLADGTNIDTVNHQGETPLMVAAKIGNPRILDIVLSHDPAINQQNKRGETALMIAAEAGLDQVVRKLIDNGADPSIKNKSGITASTLAAKFGHSEVVDLFQSEQNSRIYAR